MILFILLDVWMQHLLLEAANKTSESIIDFTPIFVKHYEKMRRIAFFEIVCKINNYLDTHFCFSWTLTCQPECHSTWTIFFENYITFLPLFFRIDSPSKLNT